MVDRPYKRRNTWQRGALRRAVLAKSGGRCVACGNAGTDGKGKGLALAHVVPWPYGGETVDNLQAMCASCHRSWDARRSAARPLTSMDTPGEHFASRSAPQPSLGHARTGAVLPRSRGVGAGSPALPPGFGGFWDDQGPFSGGSQEGTEKATTREIDEVRRAG